MEFLQPSVHDCHAASVCQADKKLQMEMEKGGGGEERRPDVALCPLTWSHGRLERTRRRTGGGKRDVEQILLMGEKQCDYLIYLIYLKMLETKRSFEPQEGEKGKSCDGGWTTEGLRSG